MKFAQVLDGLVENVILLDDESLIPKFQEGFVFLINIDNEIPEPTVGSTYDGVNFGLPKALPIKDQVFNAISNYQDISGSLLADIYTANKLAGLTTAQSDKMFDQFGDVVLRIREGAFPTALYRLQQKVPGDFVTQDLLNSWIDKLKSYM